MTWYPEIDNWIVITGIFAAVSCALVGNFMVLRRLSMMGDAISHAVLPGLAIAFLATHSRGSVAMFVGAAAVGLLTAVFTHSIHHFGRVEQSAAMGVTFTTLFALGLLLIVRAADSVDLDPGCVLYGSIEQVPLDLLGSEQFMPTTTKITLGMMLINILFVILFYKELRLASFDPALATTLGISSQFVHYLLMTMVSITVVAAFESVGSILVIAMLIVSPATARLLTDKLWLMILLSTVLAILAAVLGHVGAIGIPQLLGLDNSTSTAGMMAVAAGLLLLIAMLLAPEQGVISRIIHRLRLGQRITREDILGMLFRLERGGRAVALPDMSQILHISGGAGPIGFRIALRSLAANGKIERDGDKYLLTDDGRQDARQIIRSHRLWEMYLHQFVNLPPEELHFPAEQLEHITDPEMQDRLAARTHSPETDPHGSDIPDK
jgi:manganese/zinc/iron transport system permease protein